MWLSGRSLCRNNNVTALEALYCSFTSARQFTIAAVKCAPLIFSCCLRVSTKLLFIIAGYFHVMLCVIMSLIKPIKLSKILVYNSLIWQQLAYKATVPDSVMCRHQIDKSTKNFLCFLSIE